MIEKLTLLAMAVGALVARRPRRDQRSNTDTVRRVTQGRRRSHTHKHEHENSIRERDRLNAQSPSSASSM
jgi:hypothetical protein